jgi:hypothetical protein
MWDNGIPYSGAWGKLIHENLVALSPLNYDVRYLDCGMVGAPPGGVWRWAEEGEGGRVQEQAGQVGGRGNPVEQVHQVPVQDRVQVRAGRLCTRTRPLIAVYMLKLAAGKHANMPSK